ncbi:hypothetical protein GCM10023188_12230 [Pontibacter saemangeumensis]|uniref:Glycosyltransferase 2-like domain-containing protein n=1 Tax=Pontibacter saemangeumensis TaxID=1084525 RepID=A0ABP8LFW3_9BACT
MNDIVKISVIIPTYNRADTILYCLESILKQTYPVHEIIIVDDVSTDATEDVILKLNNPKVKFISLDKKGGAQAARNLGIYLAEGNWIAFQDSDDEWRHDKIQKQVDALKQHGYNENIVVHTNCITYTPSTNVFEAFEIPVIDGESNKVYRQLLLYPSPLFPTLLVSKKALERINYLDTHVKSFQEWDTCIRLAQNCRFIHIQEPLFVYHLHNGATISKDVKNEIKGYYFIRSKFKSEIIANFGNTYFYVDVFWIVLRALKHHYQDVVFEIISEQFSNQKVFLNFTQSLSGHDTILSWLIRLTYKLKDLAVKNKI